MLMAILGRGWTKALSSSSIRRTVYSGGGMRNMYDECKKVKNL